MKEICFILIAFLLIQTSGCSNAKVSNDLERNKEIAVRYHDLNPNDIELIFTENYYAQNELGRRTWNREDHRQWLSNGRFKKDSILNQVAEGDWVATRFVRTMEWKGDTIVAEAMHFKRFENGKIAELLEYGDSRQYSEGQ